MNKRLNLSRVENGKNHCLYLSMPGDGVMKKT